ncbi:MAG: phosphotransferase [Candidatus Hydrogenedentes bacterium]|nr:phosphotransferase [Candidatus Hydrogenedentota bacterium]
MVFDKNDFEKIGAILKENYDLGAFKTPYFLETTHQRRHYKLVVESEAGKFLLKTYDNDPVTLAALYFQHNLAYHLLKNELPVANIKRTRDGHSFVCLDNRTLELQEFLDGGSMPVTENTLQISGSALGRFHQVCQGMPAPPRDARKWRFSEVPTHNLKEFFERALSEDKGPKTKNHCNNIFKFLNDAKTELDADKRHTFETGIIHGDWHSGNLLFINEKLNGIIDMEFAGDGCYLEDLSYAVSNLCIRSAADEKKMEHRIHMLLSAYERHRTLSYAEQVALYYAVGIKHITTISYQMPKEQGLVAGYTPRQWMVILDFQTQWMAKESHKARWGE